VDDVGKSFLQPKPMIPGFSQGPVARPEMARDILVTKTRTRVADFGYLNNEPSDYCQGNMPPPAGEAPKVVMILLRR